MFNNSTTATRPSSTSIFSSHSSQIPLPDSEVELSDNMDIDQVSPPPSPPPTRTSNNVVNIMGTLVTFPTASECARDPRLAERPSHASVLGKYMLFAKVTGSSSATATANSSGTGTASSSGTGTANSSGTGTPISSKELQRCINVQTREQFSCWILPRNATGLGLVASYHRLGEFSDCICEIHEVVMSPRLVYIMFPLNHGSVHSYLMAKKKLTEAEAALFFKQMVSAVKYCHGKGIVLRDLKMGKFVFCDEERTQVKLESLEDAVMLSDYSDDALSDRQGCLNYLSPEKVNSLRSRDVTYPGKANDIWCLGVILYTMIVGDYPFNDVDQARLYANIRKCHLTTPKDSNLSRSVKFLLMGLLNKDHSRRLNCERILSHPWLLNNGRSPLTLTRPTPRRTGGLNNSRSGRTATATAALRRTGKFKNSRATRTATATEPIEPAQPDPNSSEQDDDQVVPEFNV